MKLRNLRTLAASMFVLAATLFSVTLYAQSAPAQPVQKFDDLKTLETRVQKAIATARSATVGMFGIANLLDGEHSNLCGGAQQETSRNLWRWMLP